jgi:hypothetical protein
MSGGRLLTYFSGKFSIDLVMIWMDLARCNEILRMRIEMLCRHDCHKKLSYSTENWFLIVMAF